MLDDEDSSWGDISLDSRDWIDKLMTWRRQSETVVMMPWRYWVSLFGMNWGCQMSCSAGVADKARRDPHFILLGRLNLGHSIYEKIFDCGDTCKFIFFETSRRYLLSEKKVC